MKLLVYFVSASGLVSSILLWIVVSSVFLTRRSYAVVAPPPERDFRVRVVEAVLLGEARGEGPGGVERVAEVIRNRTTESVFFGHTAMAVVQRSAQFSCLNNTTPEGLLEQRAGWRVPVETSNMAQRCAYQLVFPDSIYGRAFGPLPDNVHGATHYHAAGVQPAWARKLKPVATYKNHIFYRP